MGDTTYANNYRNVNFRDEPHKYKIGKGEQGVLLAEPYKSEILPYWRFATKRRPGTIAKGRIRPDFLRLLPKSKARSKIHKAKK